VNVFDLIALIFTCWAVYVTVKKFRTPQPATPPVRLGTPVDEITWGKTCGFRFDDEPAEPFNPPVELNNMFTEYDTKLAAANPADYDPPRFSIN
jgi:hypothetical protein